MRAATPTYFVRSGKQGRSLSPGYFEGRPSFVPEEPPVFPDIPEDLWLPEDRQLTDGDIWRMASSTAGDSVGSYMHYPDVQKDIIASEKAAARLGLRDIERLSKESLASLYATQIVSGAGVIETPLIDGTALLADGAHATLSLKLENMQRTGSYKLRGASYMLDMLTETEREAGVATFSAGNHAAAVAYAAHRLATPATVFMPRTTPQAKQHKVRDYGARIMLAGRDVAESHAAFADYMKDAAGRTAIPPFDHEHVIRGQSTAAVEVLAQSSDVTHIFVPLGGGGLASAVARYSKHNRPDVKVVGVEVENQDAISRSLQAGKQIELQNLDIWADGTAVRKGGELTFEYLQQYLDTVVVVSKRDLALAVVDLYEFGQKVEPAGALALAGVRKYARSAAGDDSYVAICSGGNVDNTKLAEAYSLAGIDVPVHLR